jgi:hypothetical protein
VEDETGGAETLLWLWLEQVQLKPPKPLAVEAAKTRKFDRQTPGWKRKRDRQTAPGQLPSGWPLWPLLKPWRRNPLESGLRQLENSYRGHQLLRLPL